MSQSTISQEETLMVLIGYVERASEAFLEKYNLKKNYQAVKNKAEQGTTKHSLDYINALMNGTVDEMVFRLKKPNNEIHDEFIAFYLSGSF